ncbi:MAG: hypothetical protein ABI548_20400 [Polyangiaceae bacterium]
MKRAASLVGPVPLLRLLGLGLGLGLLTPACGLSGSGASGAAAPSRVVANAASAPHVDDKAPDEQRKVGDFSVHRFSGSYQKSPLTMTEEVVAKEDGLWVIDYTFEEQAGSTKLRVRFDPRTDSVVRAATLDGNQESAVQTALFDKMIDRTSFAADGNDGQIASTRGTCLVGPSELECETKTYSVRVGDQLALLNVSRSASVPNGDVAGDITASDGTLIYRSELVEMGNGATPKLGVASR